MYQEVVFVSFRTCWLQIPKKWLEAKKKIETSENAKDAIDANLKERIDMENDGKTTRGGKTAMKPAATKLSQRLQTEELEPASLIAIPGVELCIKIYDAYLNTGAIRKRPMETEIPVEPTTVRNLTHTSIFERFARKMIELHRQITF